MENFNLNKNDGQDVAFARDQFNSLHIESEKIYLEEMQRREYLTKRRYNRVPLILALLGLLVSFLFGLGIAFAIPSLAISVRRCLKAPSKPLRWAITISIVTIFLCVIFIACTCYAVAQGFFELMSQPLA